MPLREIFCLIMDAPHAGALRTEHIEPVVVPDKNTVFRLFPDHPGTVEEKCLLWLFGARLFTRDDIRKQASHAKLLNLHILNTACHVRGAVQTISPFFQLCEKSKRPRLLRHVLEQRSPVELIHFTRMREDRQMMLHQNIFETKKSIMHSRVGFAHPVDDLVHALIGFADDLLCWNAELHPTIFADRPIRQL